MAEKKVQEPVENEQEKQEEKQEFYVGDIEPAEAKFICKLCHIAANKRMADKLECAEIKLKGQYCRPIEKLRNVFLSQKKELEVSRKYISAFMNGRTVFRKEELERLYRDNISEGERSFDEFLSYCQLNGIEVVGD